MITTWLLRTLLVGLFLGVAALAAERVAGWLGVARRWVWVAAMVGSLAIPGLAFWAPGVVPEIGLAASWLDRWTAAETVGLAALTEAPKPETTFEVASVDASAGALSRAAPLPAAFPHELAVGEIGAGAPVRSADPAVVIVGDEGTSPSGRLPVAAMLGLWAMSTLGVLGVFAWGTVRLRLLRAESTPAMVDGVPVRLSRGLGPAVVGFYRPEVVIPRWVLGAPAEERRLILAHEREHVAARDSWLLVFGMLALAVMPWNVPLWWQHRRLRLAVETDCDARVVAYGASRRAYGEVLLRAASGAPVLPWLSPAWGETPSHLEQRILAITARRPRYGKWFSVPLLVVALTIGAVACDVAQRGRTAASPESEPLAQATGSAAGQQESFAVAALSGAYVSPALVEIAHVSETHDRTSFFFVGAEDTQPGQPHRLAPPQPPLVLEGSHPTAPRAQPTPPTVISLSPPVPPLEVPRASPVQLARWLENFRRHPMMQVAIADPSSYAWVVLDAYGRLLRSGNGRMPPPGEVWDSRSVVRQLGDRLAGLGPVAHIHISAGQRIGEGETRANVIIFTLPTPDVRRAHGGVIVVTPEISRQLEGIDGGDPEARYDRVRIREAESRGLEDQGRALHEAQEVRFRIPEVENRRFEDELRAFHGALEEDHRRLAEQREVWQRGQRGQQAEQRAIAGAIEASVIPLRTPAASLRLDHQQLEVRPAPITEAVRPVAYGTISGVITDLDGRVIPGASVTLQPLRRGTVTTHDGRFALVSIPPGTYTLVGVRPNTGRMIRREVEVEGGDRQTIHIAF